MTQDQQYAMFGGDPHKLLESLGPTLARDGLGMVLMSMLSDAQELLAAEFTDHARRVLNQVKFILMEKLPRVHVAPGDVSVERELAHLRDLLSKTSDRTWHCLPGRALTISGTCQANGYAGFDVLRGHGRTAQEAKANAMFGAKMHNAAEALFDAAALVQHVLNEQDKLPRDQRDPYIVDQAQATLSKLKAALA